MYHSLDEIHQEVITRLKAQGSRGTSQDGERCHYRTPNGLKCAVGVLIPDDLYNPSREGHKVRTLFNEHTSLHTLFSPDILEEAIDLLAQLQHIHDMSPTFEKMLLDMEALS
jgi:hypothetical protein